MRLTLAEAVRAEVANILVVAALVEEATDLVHPAVAVVALHPGLLLLPVVLALDDVDLLDALPVHIHVVALLVLEAVVAPIALQLLHRRCRVVGLHTQCRIRKPLQVSMKDAAYTLLKFAVLESDS